MAVFSGGGEMRIGMAARRGIPVWLQQIICLQFAVELAFGALKVPAKQKEALLHPEFAW
jgi:hypothetical protein